MSLEPIVSGGLQRLESGRVNVSVERIEIDADCYRRSESLERGCRTTFFERSGVVVVNQDEPVSFEAGPQTAVTCAPTDSPEGGTV